MTTSSTNSDANLAVAERQLALLGELGEMAMVVCRANAAASVAAAHAVEEILADEYWQPETGRARAIAGAKDAADAFQKATRALRLTLMLEKTVATWAGDMRAGVVPAACKDAGGISAVHGAAELLDSQSLSRPSGRHPAGSRTDDRADLRHTRPETERPEFDRPETLLQAPFRATVERICAEVGAQVDWKTWKVGPPDLVYAGLQPKPPGWSPFRPPAARAIQGLSPLESETAALPP